MLRRREKGAARGPAAPLRASLPAPATAELGGCRSCRWQPPESRNASDIMMESSEVTKTNTESIWREFGGALRGYIAGKVGSPEDREDILQDVFCRIHSHLPELRDSGKVAAWIYRITRSAIADYYRQRRPETGGLPFAAAEVSEPEEENEAVIKIAGCLKAMLGDLPEKYREAIRLTEYEGLTQKAVGEKLGLSLPGAKSRVQRARKMLREKLLACCALEFDRRGGLIDYEHRTVDCPFCDQEK